MGTLAVAITSSCANSSRRGCEPTRGRARTEEKLNREAFAGRRLDSHLVPSKLCTMSDLKQEAKSELLGIQCGMFSTRAGSSDTATDVVALALWIGILVENKASLQRDSRVRDPLPARSGTKRRFSAVKSESARRDSPERSSRAGKWPVGDAGLTVTAYSRSDRARARARASRGGWRCPSLRGELCEENKVGCRCSERMPRLPRCSHDTRTSTWSTCRARAAGSLWRLLRLSTGLLDASELGESVEARGDLYEVAADESTWGRLSLTTPRPPLSRSHFIALRTGFMSCQCVSNTSSPNWHPRKHLSIVLAHSLNVIRNSRRAAVIQSSHAANSVSTSP